MWAAEQYQPSGDSSTLSRTRSLRMTGIGCSVIPGVGASLRRGGAQDDMNFLPAEAETVRVSESVSVAAVTVTVSASDAVSASASAAVPVPA